MTSRIEAHLRSVWRRDQRLHGTSGLLTLLSWALLLFLASLTVDWLCDLPSAARAVLLGVLVSLASYRAWKQAWRLLHTYDAPRTALRAEKQHGGLNSMLVTAVQLGESGVPPGVSPELCAETQRLAEEAAGSLRVEDAVSFTGLRRLSLIALVPTSLFVVLAIVNGPLLATGIVRIFVPWSTIAYPTRTQIEILDGNRIVQEGQGLRIVGRLSGEVPESARIVLRTGKGQPRERRLTVVDGACTYEAETVFRSFDYRVAAGDASSAWYTVHVVSSPRIEHAEVRLTFPTYTERPVETVEALTLAVPEGTEIAWKLTLDRAVRQAELRLVEGESIPLEIGPGGRQVMLTQVAGESRAYSFGWVDAEHGFAFSSPRHYLQVAPDRAPGVELTSPAGMLYATLERPLNFAFRGRDDHGIGEATMAFRVGKTAEERVPLPTPEVNDGQEQRLDWDYREALPDLAIGDTVSFAVEVADRYPGPDGPHRARSDSRRVRFLSEEDYLAQIEKERRRLLARLRSIYREERGVHELIRDLDPSDATFVQTCQLEAVRQDLLRDRLDVIRERIDALVEDVAANGLSLESQGASLVELSAQLSRIGDEQLSEAASLLRGLAAVDDSVGDPGSATDAVHRSARELGMVVLGLGFAEASDVMARELHATAQIQASLRLLTVLGASATNHTELAQRQLRLAEETAHLLAAMPRNKESTERDALIAFNLSRLVNGLVRARTDERMREAAELVTGAELTEAAKVQAELIAALLHAEFRLRRGAEYEALARARDLFDAQLAGLRRLQEEGATLPEADLVQAQSALGRRLQLLLMPAIPAARPQLFDAVAPAPPSVAALLARAERALEAALAQAEAGNRQALGEHQRVAEGAFADLRRSIDARMESMTLEERTRGTVAALGKQAVQQLMLEERLLLLLEQIEDALDGEAPMGPLVPHARALAEDASGLRGRVVLWNESVGASAEEARPMLVGLEQTVDALEGAVALLESDEADAAIELLEEALDALEEGAGVLEERARTETAFADTLVTTKNALAPSPLLAEILAEQVELSTVTGGSTPEGYPDLVVPQRNLIHAVNAVLTSLDPLAHEIESGTVMLFAKEDMDAAAIGLETDDVEEVLDAQAFVVESLEELRAKIDAFTPEYRYVLEVTEFLHGLIPRSELVIARSGEGDVALLRRLAEGYGADAQRLTGAPRFAETASQLVAALGSPEELEPALEALAHDAADLRTIAENLAYLITPPPLSGFIQETTPEVVLLHDVIAIAGHHQDLARWTRQAEPPTDLAAKQRALAEQSATLVPRTDAPHPQLVAASSQLARAATHLEANDPEAAQPLQQQAADALRAFLLEYALEHVQVPPPPPPQDPAPSDSVPEDGELQLFLPGALTGTRPKGGRLEWQVLGRRDRAALNENFARELPLEYRALLKDYYQRLTR